MLFACLSFFLKDHSDVLYKIGEKNLLQKGDACMDDAIIIELFFERSEQAIAETIQKYEKTAESIAFHVLKDAKDVEECLNDTWLQLWNTIPPARPDSLPAFISKIARNVSLNRYHANTAQKRNSSYDAALDELEYGVSALETVETEYEGKELAAYLNHFLSKLPYDDRYLFVRRYWFGDPVSDIAEQMHISANAASIRLHRLRKRLQAFLRKEDMMA